MNYMNKEELFRNQVIEKAQIIFQQYGLSKTTMEDIAKALGKGKSTLYYYYANKEEIFEAVVTKELNEVFAKVKDATDMAETAEDKLWTYFLTIFKLLTKKVNLYNIIAKEINGNEKIINGLRYKYDSNEVKMMSDILTLGVKNKEFSIIKNNEIEIISYTIVKVLRSLELDLFFEGKIPSFNKQLSLLINVLIKGLKK